MAELSRAMKEAIRAGRVLEPWVDSVMHNYKEPLRKVEDGYGYMGVVTYNKDETHTQCHICGYFFKNLGVHLHHVHEISVRDYKVKFRLRMKKSLVASKTRKKYLDSFEALTASQKRQIKTNLAKGIALKQKKPTKTGAYKSLEQKNEEGSCPDQLLDKIKKLAEILGHTPTMKEFKQEYGGYLWAVQMTFGTWKEALKILDLSPAPVGQRPRYTRESVIAMLRDFEKSKGRQPYMSDIRDGMLPSQWVCSRLFGSWNKAKQAASSN
jgi:hypothetical protein